MNLLKRLRRRYFQPGMSSGYGQPPSAASGTFQMALPEIYAHTHGVDRFLFCRCTLLSGGLVTMDPLYLRVIRLVRLFKLTRYSRLHGHAAHRTS